MRPALLLLSVSALFVCLPSLWADDKDVPEGFEKLFNGKDLKGWQVNEGGHLDKWGAADGLLFTRGSGGGWLMTEKEYGDFELRLEFKVPKAGNSGVALHAPERRCRTSTPAWKSRSSTTPGISTRRTTRDSSRRSAPARSTAWCRRRRTRKPAGEWNTFRIVAKGRQITVELNGTKVVDANLDDHKDKAKEHSGMLRDKGHVGLQSHDGRVEFRNIYVKPL